MALIKCPECEKEISDKAVSCPNCGYPMKPQKDKIVQKTVVKRGGCLTTLLLAAFLVAALGHIPVTVGSGKKKKKKPLLHVMLAYLMKKKIRKD